MVRTQIQLTRTQAERVKRLAAARGVSMAEIIRESVDRHLADAGPADRAERIQRALAMSGAFSSGLKDLARRHDAYLDEVRP